MNVERVKQLAEHMRGLPPERYNQRCFVHSCGTPACIAGHAAHLAGEFPGRKTPPDVFDLRVYNAASRWLGLGFKHTDDLFRAYPFDRYEPTNIEAANVLDILAETGKVDWAAAREYH